MTIRAVDVEGAFRGAFGYDRHLRAFVRELHQRGIAVRLFDHNSGNIGTAPVPRSSWQDPFFESLTRPVRARVLMQSRMPHLTQVSSTQAVVNLTTFEATGIPANWVTISRVHPMTIVNAESSRAAWIASGAPEDRVRVCPLGVDVTRYSPTVEPMRLRLADGRWIEHVRTRFLNVSAIQPRKNLTGLMRAWLRATSANDDAVLILKLTAFSSSDFHACFRSLQWVEQEVGKSLDAAAPYLMVFRTFPDDAMPRLFAAATHYLSVSHGEGWDLPMSEAAATGLRLIAPDHSAFRSYLDASVARMIPSREVPTRITVPGPSAALFAGQHWWEPDEDAVVAAIRDAIDGHDHPVASARERMQREFTWGHATGKLIDLLTEAEAMAPQRRWWPTVQTRLHRSHR